VAEASTWRSPAGRDSVGAEATASPSARSNSSSSSSEDSSRSFRSEGVEGDHETEPSTSPEQSENGDTVAGDPTPKATRRRNAGTTTSGAPLKPLNYEGLPNEPPQAQSTRKHPAYRYGTPEMPRGTANLPHLPAKALNPRVPSQGHVKHLPRAEKLPLTGYELLVSRLTARPSSPFGNTARDSRRGSFGGASVRSGRSSSASFGGVDADGQQQQQIKPMYRRFEALNHRLLLHLQDELAELEEQLHRLDTADTQTRRLQNRILPASRRAEYLSGGELQWHKTDVLGKIGFKLGQYSMFH